MSSFSFALPRGRLPVFAVSSVVFLFLTSVYLTSSPSGLFAAGLPWKEADLLTPTLSSSLGGPTDMFDDQGIFKHDTRATRYVAGIPGWSSFENLYAIDGGFVAVTDHPSTIPEPDTLITDMSFEIVTPDQARERWYTADGAKLGRRTTELKGGTILMVKSGWGGTTYYYHFVAEVFAGLYYLFASSSRLYTFPRRMINSGDQWTGFHGGLNEWFMKVLAPSTQMQDGDVWTEMGSSNRLHLFDEITVFDRWAAHRHNQQAQAWNKAMGGLYDAIPSRDHWWSPVREAMKSELRVQDRASGSGLPKVTYVSRQPSWHRKLVEDDHNKLVTTLSAIPGIDFQLAEFEHMTPAEQISLALRTDVMIGVHGSGLTHEVWMRNGSALIEIFDSESFIRDYQMVAAPLGFKYFPIHNDTVYDWKKEAKELKLGPMFKEVDIQVWVPTVEKLVVDLVRSYQ